MGQEQQEKKKHPKANKTSFKKGHPGSPGNKNSCRYKLLVEHGLLEEAYLSYCNHLASGRSSNSWYFIHPKVKVSERAFESYFVKYPESFDRIDREIAISMGYEVWENKICQASERPIKESSPALFQMIMRNKFRWDSHQFGAKSAPETFDTILKVLRKVNDQWEEV